MDPEELSANKMGFERLCGVSCHGLPLCVYTLFSIEKSQKAGKERRRLRAQFNGRLGKESGGQSGTLTLSTDREERYVRKGDPEVMIKTILSILIVWMLSPLNKHL